MTNVSRRITLKKNYILALFAGLLFLSFLFVNILCISVFTCLRPSAGNIPPFTNIRRRFSAGLKPTATKTRK